MVVLYIELREFKGMIYYNIVYNPILCNSNYSRGHSVRFWAPVGFAC